jgi:16S rRNA (uracil1498-N3)-methyltransferase
MRALYLEDLLEYKISLLVTNHEQVHHLNNVVRVKKNETILILNGKGYYVISKVVEIQKKSIQLEFQSEIKFEEPPLLPSVAIGAIKREAIELSLRQLVEIGVKEIYIYQSKYSQRHEPNHQRLEKILISALEQSNAKYLPSLNLIDFSELLNLGCENYIYFSSVAKNDKVNKNFSQIVASSVVIIGPEGGLSADEEEIITEMSASTVLNLPTNILRTSTAVSFCLGYVLGLRQKN